MSVPGCFVRHIAAIRLYAVLPYVFRIRQHAARHGRAVQAAALLNTGPGSQKLPF